MPKTVTATTYLQVEPDWNKYYGQEDRGEAALRGAKVVAATQTRPRRQRPGTVLVKLSIEVPSGAFLPLRPEAVVVIPEGMTVTGPITIEAQNPDEL